MIPFTVIQDLVIGLGAVVIVLLLIYLVMARKDEA